MPASRNTDSPEEVAQLQVALAVETLSNIHYLIEQSCDDPESVKKFVEMAVPAMDKLRELAWRREVKFEGPVVNEAQTPLQGEPDRRDPLPLAAAGEDSVTSGPEAPPETRVDRLEAD